MRPSTKLPSPMPSSSESGDGKASLDVPLQALLIGVDHHAEVPSIDLEGAVADVQAMKDVLIRRGVCPGAMRCLVSPLSREEGADPDLLPTYSNMVREIRHLGRRAAVQGGHALLYFSGHGSRASSLLPSGKTTGDDCLIPCDVGRPGVRWLRDVELTYLLHEMLEAGVQVTCIVDACHGAGIFRHGEVLRARNVRTGDDGIGVPKLDSEVASVEALTRRWRSIHRQRTVVRRSHSASDGGWLAESVRQGRGITLLAACRQHEEALEYPIAGSYRGVMTYHLVELLETASIESEANPPMTWPRLHARLADALRQFGESLPKSGSSYSQHPILEGDGSGVLFEPGSPPNNRILLKSIDGDRVRLGAGQAWGLEPGALLTSVPYGEKAGTIHVVVRHVAAEEAWAQCISPKTGEELTVGEGLRWLRRGGQSVYSVARDVPQNRSGGHTRRRTLRNGAPATAPDEQIAIWLEKELAGLAMWAPEWRVQVQNGRCRVIPPADLQLAEVPTVPISTSADVQQVIDQLQHFNLWQHFRQLRHLEEEPYPLTLQLAPQLGGASPDSELVPGTSLQNPVECHQDQIYLLGMTWNGRPPMHPVVLTLGDDGSMGWLHPDVGSGDVLEPGQTLWIRWTAKGAIRQRIRVIVTTSPLAVSRWSLPPVGQASLHRPAAEPLNAASPEPMGGETPWDLDAEEQFYFTDAHEFWASTHLDVQMADGDGS